MTAMAALALACVACLAFTLTVFVCVMIVQEVRRML